MIPMVFRNEHYFANMFAILFGNQVCLTTHGGRAGLAWRLLAGWLASTLLTGLPPPSYPGEV